LTPIDMDPSLVTAKDSVIVAPPSTNGSSPVAALATAARIVSMASVSTSSRPPSRTSSAVSNPSVGGVRLMSI
jgi:ABC-type sugar transport system substrate-binding protein